MLYAFVTSTPFFFDILQFDDLFFFAKAVVSWELRYRVGLSWVHVESVGILDHLKPYLRW